MKIPDKLYHATWKKNLFSIYIDGLKPGFDGLVYMSDTPENSAKFLVLRQTDDEMISIEIETKNLNKDLFQEGNDHSPAFFGNALVLTYPKKISSKALKSYFDMVKKEDKNV